MKSATKKSKTVSAQIDIPDSLTLWLQLVSQDRRYACLPPPGEVERRNFRLSRGIAAIGIPVAAETIRFRFGAERFAIREARHRQY